MLSGILSNIRSGAEAFAMRYLPSDFLANLPQDTMDAIFTEAANTGNLAVIKALCGKVDPRLIITACIIAFRHHSAVVVTILDEDLELSSETLLTILNLAAAYFNITIVRKILTQFELSNEHKGQALRTAAKNMFRDTVRELIRLVGDDISFEDKKEALLIAFQYCHFDLAQELSDLTNIPLSAEDKGNALVRATHSEDSATIAPLLALRNEIPSRHKGLALLGAIEAGHTSHVRNILVDAGQEISPDVLGQALVTAVRRRAVRYIEELFNRVGIRLLATHKKEALFWAVSFSRHECIRELLTKDPSIDKGTALFQVATLNQVDAIELLFTVGDPLSDEDIFCALEKAVEENYFNVVNALLLFGHTSSQDRGEALILAAQKRHFQSFKAILDYTGGQFIAPSDKLQALSIIVRALRHSRCEMGIKICRDMLEELRWDIRWLPLPTKELQADALKVISEALDPRMLNKRTQQSQQVETDDPDDDTEAHQDKRTRRTL